MDMLKIEVGQDNSHKWKYSSTPLKQVKLIIFAILIFMMASFSNFAEAGLDEKIAASFAAKYQVCSLKLKDTPKYRIKAVQLKAKSDEIGREKIGNGYVKAFKKEKRKAWALSPSKCKKLANNL